MSTMINLSDITPPPMVEIENFVEMLKDEQEYYKKNKQEEDGWDVCCVGCNERVCSFNEEPPHKDSRNEAVCDECYCKEEEYPKKEYDDRGVECWQCRVCDGWEDWGVPCCDAEKD